MIKVNQKESLLYINVNSLLLGTVPKVLKEKSSSVTDIFIP